MSTRRARAGGWIDPKTLPRGPGGRPFCRSCLTAECPKGRRTFCSDGCVHEWKLRTQPAYLRRATYERDKGVCAVCGDQSVRHWEADHIVPVVEGGGECGLENIRTLCLRCHKQETAALKRRLAEQTAAAKLAPLARPLTFGDSEQMAAVRYLRRRRPPVNG